MTGNEQIVVFTLDDQRYGISLGVVERVVRMVAITHLPAGPKFVHGVINVQGVIMPVLNLRERFDLPQRPPELGDQLIITSFSGHSFALATDAVNDVRSCRIQELTTADEILPELPYLAGVAKLADGMILISDPGKLLSPCERHALDQAVAEAPP